jgi:CRP-like cAMP-binding protein
VEVAAQDARGNGPGTGVRPSGNLFIDRLAEGVRLRLLRHASRVRLGHGEIVYDVGATIERVLFPVGCVVSVVAEMQDGATVEVGFIGREGMTGLPLALGSERVAQRALIQVPDSALALSAADFTAALEAEPELRRAVDRYAQATIDTLSQYAACNRLHTITERCARWLLMAHDRVPGDTILLTHEFLSQMLGVGRSGVTVAALELQRAGLIEYTRGRIEVRNGTGLEAAACECYDAIERQWLLAMGFPLRKAR